MDGNELISFKIISNIGTAKSLYIQGINAAKEGDFEKALHHISEGEEYYKEGHTIHSDLIQQFSAGEDIKLDLLLMHAEDQMMTTETVHILAREIIDLYQTLATQLKG